MVKNSKVLPDAKRSIFEMGSVTKTFNALLLARQVVSGGMKLNDPVNLYLPDAVPALSYGGQEMSLVHLANHTSGLPRLPANIFKGKVDPKDPYKHYVTDSLFGFLARYRISAAPGKVFSYSNLGAGLLGTILELRTGRSFEEMIVRDIARPLGMLSTKVTLNAAEQARFVQGYDDQGNPASAWNLASLKGSGAIRSTLNDMILYARAQLGEPNVLSRAIALSHDRTFEGAEEGMALGWRISSGRHGQYYHHSGGTGGFRSFVAFDKGRQFGVIILSNAAVELTGIAKGLFE